MPVSALKLNLPSLTGEKAVSQTKPDLAGVELSGALNDVIGGSKHAINQIAIPPNVVTGDAGPILHDNPLLGPLGGAFPPAGTPDDKALALKTLHDNYDQYEHDKNGYITEQGLYKAAYDKSLPGPVRAAALYFVTHPDKMTSLDTSRERRAGEPADNHDGLISREDIESERKGNAKPAEGTDEPLVKGGLPFPGGSGGAIPGLGEPPAGFPKPGNIGSDSPLLGDPPRDPSNSGDVGDVTKGPSIDPSQIGGLFDPVHARGGPSIDPSQIGASLGDGAAGNDPTHGLGAIQSINDTLSNDMKAGLAAIQSTRDALSDGMKAKNAASST